ncbi:MAG: CcmD family protein [Candidatus Latescibacteria bacterium]|nr:CcmD family protein [Candidatus Latescibacterota bacterium]
MQHLGYMAAAYAIIWAAILIYFLGLGRREREIWTELHALRESIGERKAEAGSGERQKTS